MRTTYEETIIELEKHGKVIVRYERLPEERDRGFIVNPESIGSLFAYKLVQKNLKGEKIELTKEEFNFIADKLLGNE